MRRLLATALVLSLAAPAAAQEALVEDVEDEGFEMMGDSDEEEWDDKEWDDEGWGEEKWGKEGSGPAPAAGKEQAPVEPSGDFSLMDWMRGHVDIGGYYENQLAVFALPRHVSDPGGSGVSLMDTNKLRVDLSVKPLPGFSADADVVIRTFHGSTTYHLADILPERFGRDIAELEAIDPSLAEYRMDSDIFLDNAYLTAEFWRLRLRVGKQQIRFGSGYLWNPTDPFNKKDLLDPTYEKVGVTCLRLQLFLPGEGLLEAYALPGPDLDDFHLEDAALAFRARVAVERWVFATTYATFNDVAGVDMWVSDPADLLVRSRRHMLGFEFTGELGGMGVWGEVAFNVMERGSWDRLLAIGRPDWIEALGGLSYTFRGGTMIMAEYLYDSRGGEGPDSYTLWQWLSYLDQTVRTLGRHHVTATIEVPAARIHTTFSLTGIVNVEDPSFVLNPWIRFDWNQYLALMLYGAFTWGGAPGNELGSMGQGAYVRLRFSF